jgi:hypothetical protein
MGLRWLSNVPMARQRPPMDDMVTAIVGNPSDPQATMGLRWLSNTPTARRRPHMDERFTAIVVNPSATQADTFQYWCIICSP